MVLPFTPLGELFEFERPPLSFFLVLTGLVAVYLVLVEIVQKVVFQKIRLPIRTGSGFTQKGDCENNLALTSCLCTLLKRLECNVDLVECWCIEGGFG